MVRLPKLAELTPEGMIVASLLEGAKSYGSLKSATGLSDRWLSKKLKELSSLDAVEQRAGFYSLKDPARIMERDPLFSQLVQKRISLDMKARFIADELNDNRGVIAVILFGSVAKGEARADSDIDLLVVTEKEDEAHMNNVVYRLMFKYDAPVEGVFLTFNELIENLQAQTAFSFGLLEGYVVLHDDGGVAALLSVKKKEMEDDWAYDRVAGAWIRKKHLPTLRLERNS